MAKSQTKSVEGIKVVANNRKAFHDYTIEETLEVGLVLTGSEIKSIRSGAVNLRDSYVSFRNGEAWVQNLHISPFKQANVNNHEPMRPRKLLMHRKEIARWSDRAQQKGYTVIPLRLYLKRGRAKLEIGMAKGKKLYDKRQSLAEKDANRRIDRALKERDNG